MKKMKHDHLLKKVKVRVQDAASLVTSYQCGRCDYFDFEENSAKRVINEIKLKENMFHKTKE